MSPLDLGDLPTVRNDECALCGHAVDDHLQSGPREALCKVCLDIGPYSPCVESERQGEAREAFLASLPGGD